jgi:hypothetical protein
VAQCGPSLLSAPWMIREPASAAGIFLAGMDAGEEHALVLELQIDQTLCAQPASTARCGKLLMAAVGGRGPADDARTPAQLVPRVVGDP